MKIADLQARNTLYCEACELVDCLFVQFLPFSISFDNLADGLALFADYFGCSDDLFL